MKNLLRRSEANNPVHFSLGQDATGKEYFLLLVSNYSDNFRQAKADLARSAALSASEGKWTSAMQVEATCKLCASVVVGWELPPDMADEFGAYSPEKAEALLLEYPQLQNAVDNFSSEAANFVAKKLNS